MTEKKEKILMPRKAAPCRTGRSLLESHTAGKIPQYYNALPRDCKFTYMTPGYYATGFGISDVYKTKVDFSQYRNLMFLEDPKKVDKWGNLKSRIPYPEGRVTDLPGTRELNYRNYCVRSLTSESTASWRNSIMKGMTKNVLSEEEEEEKEEGKEENKIEVEDSVGVEESAEINEAK